VGLDPHASKTWRADDYSQKLLEVQTFALPKNNPPPAWVATNNTLLLGAFASGKRLLSPHSTRPSKSQDMFYQEYDQAPSKSNTAKRPFWKKGLNETL